MRCLENKHSRTEMKSRERWGVFSVTSGDTKPILACPFSKDGRERRSLIFLLSLHLASRLKQKE